MRRTILGSLFAIVVVIAILALLVDWNEMTYRPIDQYRFAGIAALSGVGMLVFMLITGYGLGGQPKPSRYS